MDQTRCDKARKGGQKAKFECCIKLSGIHDAFIAVLTAFWFFTALCTSFSCHNSPARSPDTINPAREHMLD